MFDQNMAQNFDFDSNIVGSNNVVDNNVDINMMGNVAYGPVPMVPTMNEGVQERLVHRTFVHEVPHVCPIHTRIINHHVYKHTYRPEYTCSEENTVSNIQCGSCCQFR